MSCQETETLRIASLRKRNIPLCPSRPNGQSYEACSALSTPWNENRTITTMRETSVSQITFQTRRHLPKRFTFLTIANRTLQSEEIESRDDYLWALTAASFAFSYTPG